MPVRSLSSPVLKWPDRKTVEQALRRWVEKILPAKPEVIRIGYFGSYARGDWGVGSDLDLVVVVEQTKESFLRRPLQWDTTTLPVPTELLVYTEQEWNCPDSVRYHRRKISDETVWVYERAG